MSLNWKEINLVLDELNLEGYQIQKAIQSAYDVLTLKLYGREGARNLLISLSPRACRIHETFRSVPKPDKPLRFAEFLNSKIVNSRIETCLQLGDNRIVRFCLRQGDQKYLLYVRLWSNAANVIVTDEEGTILDAMKRLPKKGEITGGHYIPGEGPPSAKEYEIREYPLRETDSRDAGSAEAGGNVMAEREFCPFNRFIDAYYSQEGGALSLESLREEARRNFEGSIGRITASLERLRAKEKDYANADRLKEYGDIIMANLGSIKAGDQWLEAKNFYDENESPIRIKLDSQGFIKTRNPAAAAEDYYEQYHKAKSGLAEIRAEIERGEKELLDLEKTLNALLLESNPLVLHKLLKSGGKSLPLSQRDSSHKGDSKRPGLSFRRKDWLIMVGRDAAENDTLLRRHVKGNDLWLHARDFPGSYVFIKQRAGKSFPLDILLDAGNLAIFYSKGRNNGEGDLFYTPVKYLRRSKNGPKGLVIPTQEKNLHVTVEASRLRELEECKVEK